MSRLRIVTTDYKNKRELSTIDLRWIIGIPRLELDFNYESCIFSLGAGERTSEVLRKYSTFEEAFFGHFMFCKEYGLDISKTKILKI